MDLIVKVIIKKPESEHAIITSLSNSDYMIAKALGGQIKTTMLYPDIAILSDADAKKKKLPYNCKIWGDKYYGTIFLVGKIDKFYSDFPMSLEEAKRIFPDLWQKKTVHSAATP